MIINFWSHVRVRNAVNDDPALLIDTAATCYEHFNICLQQATYFDIRIRDILFLTKCNGQPQDTIVYSKCSWYLNHRGWRHVTTCHNDAWYSRFGDRFGRNLLPQLCTKAYQTATTIPQHDSLPKWVDCLLGTSNGGGGGYNSVVWVRERTIPTERSPLVGEVIANFCG
jgi:hypothetical protein